MKLLTLLLLSVTFLFALVDINKANIKELTSLKGVGIVKAKAIVEYRKINCFKNIDEIVKVKGIAKKFLEKNKKKLTLSKCKKVKN